MSHNWHLSSGSTPRDKDDQSSKVEEITNSQFRLIQNSHGHLFDQRTSRCVTVPVDQTVREWWLMARQHWHSSKLCVDWNWKIADSFISHHRIGAVEVTVFRTIARNWITPSRSPIGRVGKFVCSPSGIWQHGRDLLRTASSFRPMHKIISPRRKFAAPSATANY